MDLLTDASNKEKVSEDITSQESQQAIKLVSFEIVREMERRMQLLMKEHPTLFEVPEVKVKPPAMARSLSQEGAISRTNSSEDAAIISAPASTKNTSSVKVSGTSSESANSAATVADKAPNLPPFINRSRSVDGSASKLMSALQPRTEQSSSSPSSSLIAQNASNQRPKAQFTLDLNITTSMSSSSGGTPKLSTDMAAKLTALVSTLYYLFLLIVITHSFVIFLATQGCCSCKKRPEIFYFSSRR